MQIQEHVPLEDTKLPADVWTIRSCGLGCHGGVVTYPHHDANGASTFITVTSGVKNWIIINVKDISRNVPLVFLAGLSNLEELLFEFSHQIDTETIHLHTRDLCRNFLFAPPLISSSQRKDHASRTMSCCVYPSSGALLRWSFFQLGHNAPHRAFEAHGQHPVEIFHQ